MSQTIEASEEMSEKNPYKAAAAKLRPRTEALIDGKFVKAASGKFFASENPATGKPIAHIAECDAIDVDRAVHALAHMDE